MPAPGELSADVVIWGGVCADDCFPYLAYRLDRERLLAHSTVIGPGDAIRYNFDSEARDEVLRPTKEHAALLWALDSVPAMIAGLPTRELGTAKFYVTGGTYLEVRANGHTWKTVIWDNDVPSDAKPLKDFAERLRASLKRANNALHQTINRTLAASKAGIHL